MRVKRIAAALLAFAITVGIAGNAYAENTGQAMTAEIETAVSDKVQAEAEVSIPEPEQESESKIVRTELTEQNLPDVIDAETAIADGYVARLNSEEQSLSEVVLEKDDGTRALYLFSENVKYIDENGDVADKSNNAVRKGRAFVNEGNDVEIILPATLTAGIAVHSDELNITMKPLTDSIGRSLSTAVQTEEDTVLYSDVFDSSTDIEYTYTYSGVKENIILESYNGKNSFDYEVTTGGLSLYEDKGTLLLADESGDVKATLGEVVVFSADNKNNTFGKYKVEELEKNNRYKVTMIVDRAYLTDPDTKYPVKIDPDINSKKNNFSIQDLQVFKGKDGKGTSETSAGYSGVSRVGWTDWGACRTLLKLNGFSFSSYGITDVSQIKSAYIEIRDLMCQNIQAQIACAQFGGNVWSEGDTKTWNALNAGSAGTPLDIYIPSKPNETSKAYNVIGDGGESIRSEQGYGKQWYAWNLTGRVKNWLKYPDNLKKGLVFKMAGSMLEESSQYAKCMKTFSSMQGSNADYKPYFVINYNTTISVSKINLSKTNTSLDVGKSTQIKATISPANATNKKIIWTSSDNKIATVDSNGKIKAQKSGTVTIKAKSSSNSNVVVSCIVKVRKNPFEEDIDVLSDEDYRTVMALTRYLVITCKCDDYKIMKPMVLEAIEIIRKKDQYKWKYEMCDSAGRCRSELVYTPVDRNSKAWLVVERVNADATDMPETLGNLGLFTMSKIAKDPVLKALITLIGVGVNPPEDPFDVALVVADYLSDSVIPLSDIVSSIKRINRPKDPKKIESGDYRIVISYYPDIYSSDCIYGRYYFAKGYKCSLKDEGYFHYWGESSPLGRFLEDTPLISIN